MLNKTLYKFIIRDNRKAKGLLASTGPARTFANPFPNNSPHLLAFAYLKLSAQNIEILIL